MDWTIYWFMLPVCIAIAGVAMFSGISGAAMLIPVFLIGFPLLGIPQLTTVEAIGTSLLLETSGFGTGLYRYFRLRLVDSVTAWRLIALTLPLGMLGALASAQAPVQALRLGYGVGMVALAVILVREAHPAEAAAVDEPAEPPVLAGVPDCGAAPGAAYAPTVDSTNPPALSERRARSTPPMERRTRTACMAFAVSNCSPALVRSSPGSSPPVWAKRHSQVWSVAPGSHSRWPRPHRPSWWPAPSSAQRSRTWSSSQRTVASPPSPGT